MQTTWPSKGLIHIVKIFPYEGNSRNLELVCETSVNSRFKDSEDMKKKKRVPEWIMSPFDVEGDRDDMDL